MPPEERPVSRAEIPGMRKGLEEEENGTGGEVDLADEDGGGGDAASPNGNGEGGEGAAAAVDISAVMASVRSCLSICNEHFERSLNIRGTRTHPVLILCHTLGINTNAYVFDPDEVDRRKAIGRVHQLKVKQ